MPLLLAHKILVSAKAQRMKISAQYLSQVRLKREEVESFDAYPFSLAAVRPLEMLELHPAVTFFAGENGSGKSTLLEAIAVACGFNAEGGSRNFRFYSFSSKGIERIEYKDTEHFRVTRDFLANPQRMLSVLFAP
jgi:predicted ATPase